MKVFQAKNIEGVWQPKLPEDSGEQLVLIFGARELIKNSRSFAEIRSAFPQAEIIGCTTSGEFNGTEVFDESLCLTAIEWASTPIKVVSENIASFASSEEAGKKLAQSLPKENLRHVLVISDGQSVNGSSLVVGMSKSLPQGVSISGGMAGDAERFEQTWGWHNERAESGLIVACGLYGEALRVGHGCVGGWDTFGPDRLITRSEDNVLYELDGSSALELYKSYLGEHADSLPGSALLFPLYVHKDDCEEGVVRTILNIDTETQSMVFAGDIEQGAYARLMHANLDRLIDGAGDAARSAINSTQGEVEFALLISCVGRRIVLNQRVEEELEIVRDELPENLPLCGFYSYGEISPLNSGVCSLHNQTMTITTFGESMNA